MENIPPRGVDCGVLGIPLLDEKSCRYMHITCSYLLEEKKNRISHKVEWFLIKEPRNLVHFYLCLDFLKHNKVSQLFYVN